MFDVCVIGHITKDVIRLHNKEERMPGGTVYYTAIALKSLGMNVAVITKLSSRDTPLLDDLKTQEIPVFQRDSHVTTTFLNIYADDPDDREQWVEEVAPPFTIDDVTRVQAKVFHLGPLTQGDIPLGVIDYLADRSKISLDVQGFIRELWDQGGGGKKVRLTDWGGKEAALPFVTILKANEEEARILSRAAELKDIAVELAGYGPEEVLITCGSKPSLIYSDGRLFWIPALSPNKLVDPTGAGDTYMAGYLFLRNKTMNLEAAARFAAITASLKLESHGPFSGTEQNVREYAQADGYSL